MERLSPASSLVVVVDLQERLVPAMPAERFARVKQTTLTLLEAARLLYVRVLATEQYPKGLGPTVAPIGEKLRALGAPPIEKMTFDACGEPLFVRALSAASPRSVVLVGMETHVCVYQTARELVRRGFDTTVVADGVCSRSEENRALGLALAERSGARVAPVETVLFDWLERAGNEAFKAVSKLVK